jgi:ureidoglycolate lyase
MTTVTLRPIPITAERFAPFGDVISASTSALSAMNDARFERFDDRANIDIDENDGGHVAMSIVRCRTPTTLPYRIELVERHPLGSQAFVPLAPFSFIIVVAEPGETVSTGDLHAFVTNGSRGINYHRGVWHMPLIGLQRGQSFLLVDRAPGKGNCDEFVFSDPIVLEAP